MFDQIDNIHFILAASSFCPLPLPIKQSAILGAMIDPPPLMWVETAQQPPVRKWVWVEHTSSLALDPLGVDIFLQVFSRWQSVYSVQVLGGTPSSCGECGCVRLWHCVKNAAGTEIWSPLTDPDTG